METQLNSITVNGIEYVRVDSVKNELHSCDGLPYVLVRTHSAGVHIGYLKLRNGMEVELVNAKRIWAWRGAATLSQLAVDGVSKPKECKIPCAVPSITLTQAIEIIPVSENAKKTIEMVPIWKN